MSPNLHFIFPRTRVSVLMRMLRTTAHNAFPVVSVVDKLEFEETAGLSINGVNICWCLLTCVLYCL